MAQAAIQVLTSHIAASIADPAAGPGAEHGTMRPGPGAEYGTMRPSPGAEHGTMRPGPGAEHSTMRPGPAPEAAYRDRTAS